MTNYYLTEMNTTKLENILLKFIYKQQLNKPLVNGVTTKIVAMMYNNNIDYYYSDLVASAVDVPIKFVDNIYLNNQSQYYEDPLTELLKRTNYTGTPEDARTFEHEVNKVLQTKKKIHLNKRKHNHHKTNNKGSKATVLEV